jgi:hypothetical protein
MSDDNILGILELMLEGRNGFLNNNTLRALDYHTRNNIVSRYMLNDAAMLEFLNRMYIVNNQNRNAPTTFVTLTLPNNPNLMESVVVTASSQQIESSLETIDSQETACAICQDAISTGGVRIRHCSHGFHRTCITNWFSMSVRCPVCRHDIREANPGGQTSPASSQTSAQLEGQ